MKKKKLVLLLSACLLAVGSLQAQKNKIYLPWENGKLQVSEENRYLKHENGTPFFWLGETSIY